MNKKLIIATALLFGANFAAQAQLDLVNPVPQQVERSAAASIVDAPKAWSVKCDAGKHADVLNVLSTASVKQEKGAQFTLTLGVKGDKSVKKFAKKVPAKTEGYYLQVDAKGVVIAAADESGLFHGVQTLLGMMAKGKLEYCQVTDYPDVPFRGVVEGFYGTPWSHAVRLDQILFYARNKMNVYIYGPKDDPWHRDKWRIPYPEEEAQRIAVYASSCI